MADPASMQRRQRRANERITHRPQPPGFGLWPRRRGDPPTQEIHYQEVDQAIHGGCRAGCGAIELQFQQLEDAVDPIARAVVVGAHHERPWQRGEERMSDMPIVVVSRAQESYVAGRYANEDFPAGAQRAPLGLRMEGLGRGVRCARYHV
jgi:hypothetical protein